MDIKRNGSQPLHGRVLARDGQVLGGLHAFWNDAVSIFWGNYPGSGTMPPED